MNFVFYAAQYNENLSMQKPGTGFRTAELCCNHRIGFVTGDRSGRVYVGGEYDGNACAARTFWVRS